MQAVVPDSGVSWGTAEPARRSDRQVAVPTPGRSAERGRPWIGRVAPEDVPRNVPELRRAHPQRRYGVFRGTPDRPTDMYCGPVPPATAAPAEAAADPTAAASRRSRSRSRDRRPCRSRCRSRGRRPRRRPRSAERSGPPVPGTGTWAPRSAEPETSAFQVSARAAPSSAERSGARSPGCRRASRCVPGTQRGSFSRVPVHVAPCSAERSGSGLPRRRVPHRVPRSPFRCVPRNAPGGGVSCAGAGCGSAERRRCRLPARRLPACGRRSTAFRGTRSAGRREVRAVRTAPRGRHHEGADTGQS
ncbi:hypothetical protein SAMN05216207_101991 [Pseudonocardia ammonioxydans]|uniref:Uncharacterized protein n=1 Tax=Pseudonocardia ammonioxydans TaxID=260086 RepID=A0A1I5B6G0_PSUAM|nr:hypothetical protein SAMN05216207_101991 [Pseudonocardia ammonioxydans]